MDQAGDLHMEKRPELYFRLVTWWVEGHQLIESGIWNELGKLVSDMEWDEERKTMREVVTPVERATVYAKPKQPISDRMRLMEGSCLALSSRTADLIRGELLCDPTIRWVPMEVLYRKTNKKLADYWLLRDYQTHFTFDYAHSDYTFIPKTEVIRKVEHYVLDGLKLPPYDFYWDGVLRWFCTPRFKELVESAGLTGFKFEPTPVHWPG